MSLFPSPSSSLPSSSKSKDDLVIDGQVFKDVEEVNTTDTVVSPDSNNNNNVETTTATTTTTTGRGGETLIVDIIEEQNNNDNNNGEHGGSSLSGGPVPLSKDGGEGGRHNSGGNCHYGSERCVYKTLIVIFVLALSGLAFAITRFVQATDNGGTTTTSSSSGGSAPQDGGPVVDTEEYRDSLTSVLFTTTTSTEVFFEPNSPQSQAVDWLIFEDTFLKTDAVVASQGRTFLDDPEPLLQRYALMVLYFATNGKLWDMINPWPENVDVPECDFIGIECNEDQRVEVIDLSRRKLRGQLPEEVGTLLTNLVYLGLSANFLEGSIPSTFYDGLSNLEVLDLQLNEMKFSLSNDIGKLSRLEVLFLNGQPVGGSLPPHMEMLQSLEILDLSSTQVSGPILDFAQYWPDLTDLVVVGSSGINGTVPDTIAESNPFLQSLKLEGTQIDAGMFPTQIGLLTDLRRLSANIRSGSPTSPIPMPTYLGQLTNLEHLWIRGSYKGYYGSIPTELGKLTNIQSLHIEDTNLSGSIPSEFGQLTSLTSLLLQGNNLEGSLPAEFGNLQDLVIIGLSYNDFTGTFPPGICSPNVPEIIQYPCTMTKCSCCFLKCEG